MMELWLALPLPVLLASCVLFFGTIAVLLIWLSFDRATGAAAQSLKGVVAPFPNVLAVILAILIGFLASDIWDRERRAATAVREEANDLVSLDRLAAVFSLQRDSLDAAIRAYASTVVQKEWPAMARQQASNDAELALDQILKAVDALQLSKAGRGDLDRRRTGTALEIRAARSTRLAMSQDHSEDVKWLSVLALAVMTQVSVALVHLDRARPQIAAIAVLTISLIVVIGLLASHELPFAPPLALSPAPIVHVLETVPGN
jgi:hypothetical protein